MNDYESPRQANVSLSIKSNLKKRTPKSNWIMVNIPVLHGKAQTLLLIKAAERKHHRDQHGA